MGMGKQRFPIRRVWLNEVIEAMQNELQFDFIRAQSLIAVLEGCKKRLTVAANDIKEAAPTGDIWVGKDQAEYMAQFEKDLPNLDDYKSVVNDTLNYLKKVSNGKSDFEKRGKNHFK